MRIYVPFTKLRAETFQSTFPARLVPILDRRWDYSRYFHDRWVDGKSFINIEHDVVPVPELLEGMWKCEKEFCFSSYKYPGQPDRIDIAYLGCCKISREFIRKNQTLFDMICPWNECEGRILSVVEEPCCHDSVWHLHADSRWPLEEVNRYG